MSKLFDSLVHSGISPLWPKCNQNISISSLLELLDSNEFLFGALIQTSPWFDSSDNPQLFYSTIVNFKSTKIFVPVAALRHHNSVSAAIQELHILHDIGFTKIKIHPRFCNLDNHSDIFRILETAASLFKSVMICTYTYKLIRNNFELDQDTLVALCAQISNKYKTPFILMHGCDVSILKAHCTVRHNPYLILDLSMTLMKYPLSSIDSDLKYLFTYFDQRICVGSDFPEWHYPDIERRLEYLTHGLPPHKIKNALINNLVNIL